MLLFLRNVHALTPTVFRACSAAYCAAALLGIGRFLLGVFFGVGRIRLAGAQ